MNINDWRARVQKSYRFRDVLRDELERKESFPRSVSLPKIPGRQLAETFTDYRRELEDLTAECKSLGVEIQFSAFQHRTLGSQALPSALVFDSRATFLKFVKKERDFATFKEASAAVLSELPALKDFFLRQPLRLLEFEGEWPRLLSVCRFFLSSPRSGRYLRQLELPNIDTKFIEERKKIILELMHALQSLGQAARIEDGSPPLPAATVDLFEERLGLVKEAPRLRFRVLDPRRSNTWGGLTDIETPLPDLINSEIPGETVFVVENKITGLCLPDHENAIVFFELGYKAMLLKELTWLRRRRLFYWGDLDTHGFAILSRLREHFPHTRSLLMDRETLLEHGALWTREERPFLGECAHLTPAESEVFHGLRENRWGPQVRLEQERVGFSKFTEALRAVYDSRAVSI